jgi:hypothetical protein
MAQAGTTKLHYRKMTRYLPRFSGYLMYVENRGLLEVLMVPEQFKLVFRILEEC